MCPISAATSNHSESDCPFSTEQSCLEGLRESNFFQDPWDPKLWLLPLCFFLHQCYIEERIWFFSPDIRGNGSLAKFCTISRIGFFSKFVFSSPSIKGLFIGALLLIGCLISVYYSYLVMHKCTAYLGSTI